VDRIIEYVPGKYAIGIKNVTVRAGGAALSAYEVLTRDAAAPRSTTTSSRATFPRVL